MRSGFTVVELIVTLAVVAILLALGVVSFQGAQVQARDKERLTDIENIARGLERRYKEGNSVATSTYSDLKSGRYPSLLEIYHAMGNSVAHYTPTSRQVYILQLLPGVSESSLKPPTSTGTFDVICVNTSCNSKTPGASSALDPHFGPSTGSTRDKYIYEAIASDGSFCQGTGAECVKFNLYWFSESESVVKKIESKQQ
jgi:prepilin-type N-terminal cleavage/methylation domain-containing protein